MYYPRVLFIGIQRINERDSFNNGLLLRNLFKNWPGENMAQIFCYDDNGDKGFFQRYYRIGKAERRFGKLFFRLKTHEIPKSGFDILKPPTEIRKHGLTEKIKLQAKRYLVDTGIVELIFRPKMSSEMKTWIEKYYPQVIFVQGYNLYFVWLALLLKKMTGAKLAFLTTDDWPSYLYSGMYEEPTLFRWLMRPIVKSSTQRLMNDVDVAFAFNSIMSQEYKSRYNKEFITINHAEETESFENALPQRYHPDNVVSIVSTGYFNKYRWPLLLDVDECCRMLTEKRNPVRLLVISSGMEKEGIAALKNAKFTDIIPDPGNELLRGYLKGADINILAETFDDRVATAISLSVSTKSHLFMLSQHPIIVYGHPNTGVVKYAKSEGWASVVSKRDLSLLMNEMEILITNEDEAKRLTGCSKNTFEKYHSLSKNQKTLLDALQ
ncbi:MAG: hypothetical protein H6Q19_676 [Bacteroidetes bacterium]|nr:hypothetical protein [Bacteroidota bacterium]